MNSRLPPIAGLALLLAGCAAQPAARPAAALPRPPLAAGQRPATDLHRQSAITGRTGEAGALIGRDMRGLVSQFGQPRLDISEGAGRKLQFAGAACVLDAYLYAPAQGGEPVVTHIDTREPDGSDTDSAACITALSRR